MSTLTSLARAIAADTETAQPTRTVRHLHISPRPLVFIPLALAGEANAPIAAMVGDNPDAPSLLIVPEPRDRGLRFAFAAELADTVLAYVTSYLAVEEPAGGRVPGTRYTDAPQLLVPNPAGTAFTRLLGRSTRFRRTEGEYAVAESVPLLGRWLTFFTERAEHPASSLMLAVTDALAAHWATGQSPAEDPLRCPPAGPATDPAFDNEILEQQIIAVRTARFTGDGRAYDRAKTALTDALATQLEPTWSLMWRAVDLLRTLPPGGHVAGRWDDDKAAFTRH